MSRGNDPARGLDLPKGSDTRLEALSARIKQAKESQERRGVVGPPSKADSSALGLALQLSAAFISSVAAGGLLGWGIDWLVDSSPLGLITCLLLGFGAGMFSLMRAATGPRAAGSSADLT
jgi:ATP synthase protein I